MLINSSSLDRLLFVLYFALSKSVNVGPVPAVSFGLLHYCFAAIHCNISVVRVTIKSLQK